MGEALRSHLDGFISIERFRSVSDPAKLVVLSFWRDETAVAMPRNEEVHRLIQAKSRQDVFRDYRLRVAAVLRRPAVSIWTLTLALFFCFLVSSFVAGFARGAFRMARSANRSHLSRKATAWSDTRATRSVLNLPMSFLHRFIALLQTWRQRLHDRQELAEMHDRSLATLDSPVATSYVSSESHFGAARAGSCGEQPAP